MDLRAMKLKHLKKVSKRAKRKHIALWKTFCILFLALTLVLAPLCLAVVAVDNAISTWVGGSFWELENRDENAQYFKPKNGSLQKLSHQVALEGITLLKNENAALPLPSNAGLRLVNADRFKAALEAEGFSVRENGDTVLAVWDKSADTLQTLVELKQSASVKKLILLLTDTDASFLSNDACQADAILWIGASGTDSALAEILSGEANPSGSLPHTLTLQTDEKLYSVYDGYDGAYSLYEEGIYVDYKYYETRYEDCVMGTTGAGNFSYDRQVAYPFGYGLSYTTFAYSDFAVTYEEKTDSFTVTVTVTNTGDTLGKKTLQVYAQTPYTDYDKANGVEKPSVSLVGFGKTKLLAPKMTETVTIIVAKSDLAAFDANGAKTYIMDAGKYYLTLATDAHSAVNNILTAKGFDAQGDATLTHTWEQTALDIKTYSSAHSGAYISARLTAADPKAYTDGKAQWVSRQDWEGTLSQAGAVSITDAMKIALEKEQYNPADYPVTEMPTLGAENGLKLYDVIGLPFDDAKWQTLLDQLTFADMLCLLADNYALQQPIASVQAPGGIAKVLTELAVPSKDILLATFHSQLVQDLGVAIGSQCLMDETYILCDQPTAIADSFLTGKLNAALTAGIAEQGVTLALRLDSGLTEGETHEGQSHWLNEQALREHYLRSVQYAIQAQPTTAVLLSDQRLGATWTSAQKGLLTNILRGEWGSNGQVLVTAALTAEGSAVDSILAGTTAFAEGLPLAAWELYQYGNDPVVVSAMRSACHYNLYALANSSAMNGFGEATTLKLRLPWFTLTCWIAAPVCLAAFVFFAIMWHIGRKKWKKTQEYLDYKTMQNTLREEKKQARQKKKTVAKQQSSQGNS